MSGTQDCKGTGHVPCNPVSPGVRTNGSVKVDDRISYRMEQTLNSPVPQNFRSIFVFIKSHHNGMIGVQCYYDDVSVWLDWFFVLMFS